MNTCGTPTKNRGARECRKRIFYREGYGGPNLAAAKDAKQTNSLSSSRFRAFAVYLLEEAPFELIARFSWLVLLATVSGCAKLPFEAEPLPALVNPDVPAIRQRFARALPDRFTSDDTIIIQAPFHHDLAVLGVLRVDRRAGTFELIALNHLGIKLFDLSGDRAKVSIGYVLPQLTGRKDVLMSFGRDIGRMYLDLVPAKGDTTEIESNRIQYYDRESEGTVVYEFAGDPAVLREKWLEGFFGAAWRVRYYRYSAEIGGLYPRGIVMDNGDYYYRIIVKNRDVEIDQ